MKKLLVVCFCCLLYSPVLIAQHMEFVPTAGYTFADKFHIPGGRAKIGDGFTYGGMLSYVANPRLSIDLTFSRTDCDSWALWKDSEYRGRMSSNYLLIGTSKYFPLNQEARFFTGAGIGMGIFAGKDDDMGSATKFAWGVKAGFKYDLSPNAGFILQANLDSPVGDVYGDLWLSSSGPSVGISSSSPFLQFGFTGGFVIRFGEKGQKKQKEELKEELLPQQPQQPSTKMPIYYD
ncbi:MAG: hypothetical protein ACK5JD_09035 [Mangrovibacterium sp.]